MPSRHEETLDPCDWERLRELSHRIIDDGIDYTRNIRERPVWQPMPDKVRAKFDEGVPVKPTSLEKVYDRLIENMMPYPMGNIHPRFWMWYMGSSNFTGALGDFLAAILGSNLGGGDHAASLIDQQVVDWFKQLLGFPPSASGTLVSGGSMANILGLTVARNVMAGTDMRANGVAGLAKPLRFYSSDQIHGCHQTAMELMGLGSSALCRTPSAPDCSMDIAALQSAVAADRDSGFHPACVIATVGTVNTGAIDDVPALAAFCQEENMWLHVDGCIGALMAIAPENKHRAAGIELAQSIALDPHKWLHAPFEVGCALVRDPKAHKSTFSLNSEYLERADRGIAAAPWLHDFGVQTSRGFRALKVWMSLQEHGIEKFGRLIDQNIAQATYLTNRINGEARLELTINTNINIVCYRYNPGERSEAALKQLNTEIMLQMQETGIAAVSDTTVKGVHCLRVAVNNHRTSSQDLDLLVCETIRLGDALLRERTAS